MEFCPQCQERVDEIYLNRLIQDACGHKKCRKCLLNEEHGCQTCSRSLKSSAVRTAGPQQQLTGLPACVELSVWDGDANHHEASQASDDFKMTTLENAIPHQPQVLEKSSVKTQLPLQVASDMSILPKKKIIPKKCGTRSSSSKCKVKRKPLLIPGYVTISESAPKFTCTLCNKSFTTRLHIRYHSYCNGVSKPFKCGECNQEFITKSHYQYHVRNHEGSRPYVCKICGKSFNQQGKLTRHAQSHLEEKTFVCSTCGHRFKNLDGLKSHTKIHTGIKAHHCTLCSKQFSEFANLKKHLIAHKGEKNFMCDECGKNFGSKSTLNTHVHTHSKVRPHVCNACGRAFSLRKDLKRHETTHLLLKPFNCQLCNQAFRRRDNFDRHMKNTHPESTLPPIIQPLPKVPGHETLSILSSDQQDKPCSVAKEATSFCDSEVENGCISENVKKAPIPKDIKRDLNPNLPNKTRAKQPDNKVKNLDELCSHTVGNDAKFTADTETCVSENNSNATKLDDGINCRTNEDPTFKTVAATVATYSPPRSAVYQAVPVINRTTVSSPNQQRNVTTSSIIKMGSSLARTSYDGTNCVRTITCTSNAQRTILPPSPGEGVTGTTANMTQTETLVNTDKIPIHEESNSKEVKNDSVSSDCPPKPKLRLYLSDLHWRKRTMELLNLRNELKADSLVYDKSLEKVDDVEEETNLSNPTTHSERIEFCNSPKNNNPDDHGTYYSKQTFYKVSDQLGEILVKGTQQKYLPHNRLRHIHPKSIVYHDPRPQTSLYQRTRGTETNGSLSGVDSGQAAADADTDMRQQHQHTIASQAKNVIVENKIGNVHTPPPLPSLGSRAPPDSVFLKSLPIKEGALCD